MTTARRQRRMTTARRQRRMTTAPYARGRFRSLRLLKTLQESERDLVLLLEIDGTRRHRMVLAQIIAAWEHHGNATRCIPLSQTRCIHLHDPPTRYVSLHLVPPPPLLPPVLPPLCPLSPQLVALFSSAVNEFVHPVNELSSRYF